MAPECEGHPAGPFDPMGETVHCDGSCNPFGESDEIMEEPRTVLVHLNVQVPRSDTRPEREIIEAIEGALSVGWDDDSVRNLNIYVALAEQIN